MSHPDQLTHESLPNKEVATDTEHTPNRTVPRDVLELEKLVSKNLTGNKRAIVDKLLALYKTEAR